MNNTTEKIIINNLGPLKSCDYLVLNDGSKKAFFIELKSLNYEDIRLALYTAYKNLEKLNNDDIEFLAKVKDVEYTGIFSKITYTINGVKVRNIEKNDGRKLPKVGEEIKLYLNPMKIMQFGDGYGK